MPQNRKIEINWSENKVIIKSEGREIFQLDINEWWSIAKALVQTVVEECKSGEGDILFVYPKSKKKFIKKSLKEWEKAKKRYQNPIILKYDGGKCVFYEGGNLLPITPEDLLKIYQQKTPNKRLKKINSALKDCGDDPYCILSFFKEPESDDNEFIIPLTKLDNPSYEIIYKAIKKFHDKGCLVESFEVFRDINNLGERIITLSFKEKGRKGSFIRSLPTLHLNPSKVVDLFKMSYNYSPLDLYGKSDEIGFLTFKIKDECKP